MTRNRSDHYLLTADAAAELASGAIAALLPSLTVGTAAAPYAVLDNFDQSLRRSGRMLLDTGISLQLLARGGVALSQPARRKGQFIADLSEGVVKRALSDLPPLRSLLPVATGTLQRGVLAFVDHSRKTQCRAHWLTLTGAGGGTAVLVTVQGLRGYDKSLASLRKRIKDVGGMVFSIDVLYARLLPDQKHYDAIPEVAFVSRHTAFDAANDIIAAYIPVVRANEAGIIADYDTEFLHDYRIALRKIRSVLSLFNGIYPENQTANLKARFSKLMEPTGPLRDLDVYLLKKRDYYDLLPVSLHKGLETKFAILAEERRVEHLKLAQHLRSKRYEREVADLAHLFAKRKKLLAGPNARHKAHAYACSLIWKRYRKVCAIAGAIGPATPDVEVHALRIHCKKLRYLMEFFGPVFAKPQFKSLLKPLKRLQDNLGLINDLSVQQANLQDFLHAQGKSSDGVDLEVAQSVGALTTILHTRQREERAKIVQSFAEFNSPRTQETFRSLFHAQKDRR